MQIILQKSLSFTVSCNPIMSNRISNQELANQIRRGESVTFEYKEALDRENKERLSTYFAAFANTEGGLFVLGINKSREVVDYILKNGESEYVSQQAENCHPPVYIDIEERDYKSNKIVLIYVPKSNNIHTDKNHRFPVRLGSVIVHLDITGLIPLAKERLGLIYGTEGLKFPTAGFLVGTEEIRYPLHN